MSIKLHKVLLRDFSSMLKYSNDYDTIIQVGENQNMKEFFVHSIILKARSTYFRRALSDEWIIKKNNMFEFKKPNIDPAVFEMILNYIYSGDLKLIKSGGFIFKLLIASDELLFEELFYPLQYFLINERSFWIRDELIFVLNTVFVLPNCNVVQDFCMEILRNQEYFMNSKNFPLLKKDTLFELLKRDDFLGDEAIVWDCLIKWSIEQTPSLKNKNRNRWNKDDFKALKEIFSQFIPFIRFLEISSADFFDKIRPFKAIIPNNIYKKCIKFYMKGSLPENINILPPRIGKLNIKSKIIKPEHAYVIANWIERKNAKDVRNENNLQYRFNLIYSSSRDGFNVCTFRRKCMNKGPCLLLIKPDPDAPDSVRPIASLQQNLAKIYGEYYSDIKQFVSMEIEVFLVSDGQYKTTREFRRSRNITPWEM
ncbi:hypothetical protein C1646_662945 [Rhizophagus diaphanus]|nr:hypothetical protein C1646_662945 [Rhizophagus diaphanus] [Rhizophagus sp. MUCL 43196]